MEELWEGAWDLHVHTDPDVIRRKLSDIEMAQRLKTRGMKGYAIKSHVSMTTGRARLINELYPEITAIGTVTLNNAVGGINPFAVEMAVRDGAKLVWLPTIDAKNETDHIASNAFRATDKTKMPFFAKLRVELAQEGKLLPPIELLKGGRLTREFLDVLDIIVSKNIALATGHIGVEETFAVAQECHKKGFKKLIVTHPNFPSTVFSKSQQKELAELGAYMEHCFTTPDTGKVSWEQVYEEIRYVGHAHCIVSTDLGQPTYVYPDEGIAAFACNLSKNGFSVGAIKTMLCSNPEFLVCA